MKRYRLLGGTLAAAALGIVVVGSGCSAAEDLANQANCSASASGAAFSDAVADLEAAADRLKVKVATACRNIALAGNQSTDWDGSGTPTDDEVTQACQMASQVIATIKAEGSFQLIISGEARCEVSLQAQAECTAECSGNVECSGDVTASCDPAHLSGQCSGQCQVGAQCEGTPSIAVACSGACTATCEGTITGGCDGTCDGTCSAGCSKQGTGGKCAGSCTGTCTGTCTKPKATAKCNGTCQGSCTIETSPVTCSGGANCTGGCSVEYTAPKCTVQVEPPECEASAECKGNCQASAQAEATCTPPEIEIRAAATVDAALVSVVADELGNLLLVAEAEGKNLAGVLGQVGTSIEAAVSSSAACALKLEAFLEASASISVSFEASVSASASAQTS